MKLTSVIHQLAPHRKGYVSDSFGATATSATDANGELVAVRVTGWQASTDDAVRLTKVERVVRFWAS